MLAVSEQMKAWAAALASELKDWPQVTIRSFFGFTALYRGKYMFGILPRTRSIFKENVVAFRIAAVNRATKSLIDKDPRISPFTEHKTRWFTFEIHTDSDLHHALDYLGRAFDAARSSHKNK